MRNNNIIRADLGSEHEKPARVMRRLEKAQFGIYRPVTDACAEELAPVLERIEGDVEEFLADRPSQPATVTFRDNMGVTYLEQRDVRKALRTRDIDLWGIRRIMTHVDNRNYRGDGEIEVPIRGFKWFGHGLSHVAGTLEPLPVGGFEAPPSTEGYLDELREDSRTVNDVLRGIGATGLANRSRTPSHVSFGRYSSPCHPSVQEAHKEEIDNIFWQRFEEAKIAAVRLGGMVVGRNYSEQLQLAV